MVSYYGDFNCNSTIGWTSGTTSPTGGPTCPYCGNFYGNHGWDTYPSYISYEIAKPDLLPHWIPPPWRQPSWISHVPRSLGRHDARHRLATKLPKVCNAPSRKQRAVNKRRSWVHAMRNEQ